MSNLDRVALGGPGALAACCVRLVHAREGIGRDGDMLTCSCGALLTCRNGVWTEGTES